MRKVTYSSKFTWTVGLLALPLMLGIWRSSLSHERPLKASEVPEPIDVGMVALLAAPERYEGKRILTHGFLSIHFENDALYLHEEDFRHALTKNSFALRLTEAQRKQFKPLSQKYVVIAGRMYSCGPERSDLWGGAIGDITDLDVWPFDEGPRPYH